MRKRAVLSLSVASLLLGAAGMLVYINARHDFGRSEIRTAANSIANQVDISGRDPEADRVTKADIERARAICEPLARQTGLSYRELVWARSAVRTKPEKHFDYSKAYRSFDDFDMLRITLNGISSEDRMEIEQHVREGRYADYERHLYETVADALYNCGSLLESNAVLDTPEIRAFYEAAERHRKSTGEETP